MTGIECKLRSNEFKATDDQFRSYAEEIKADLMKYIRVGIKNLIVVTNLDQDDASRLNSLLRTSITEPFDSLIVTNKSIPHLMKMIVELREAL